MCIKKREKFRLTPILRRWHTFFSARLLAWGRRELLCGPEKPLNIGSFHFHFPAIGIRHAANLLINLYSLLSTVFDLLKFLQELNMCSIAPCSVLLSSLIACAPQLWVMDSFTRACNSLGQIDFGSIKTFIANVLHLNLIWVGIYKKNEFGGGDEGIWRREYLVGNGWLPMQQLESFLWRFL